MSRRRSCAAAPRTPKFGRCYGFPQKADRGRRRADRARTFGTVGLPSCQRQQIYLLPATTAAVVHQNIRRIVVADEISRINARSRGTYGKRRIKAALLAQCEVIVNHKLVA
ncbi:transposase [Nocardia sp. NPDC051929]|uniref:transposase n=1 Tax=unclassified Nocardia TaxID=2637762 RepID=UPI00379C13D5